ncbi:uncharacterized protein LOC6649407 [Drosophila willistoni]|nr:uncharacterized protein LOC6649407 [Drosophila willistoni]
MNQMIYEDEFTEIETLHDEDFYLEDEVIEIAPFETNVNNNNNHYIGKRLTCSVLGCGYQTDRRWDLRRHWNSMKHQNDEVPYESDSDIKRSVFTCNFCDYKTAKKFCYERHKKSTKHFRRKEKLMKESQDDDSAEDQQEDQSHLYKCYTCDYATAKKFCYDRHVESRKHRMKIQEAEDNVDDELIVYSDIKYGSPSESNDEEFIVCEKEVFEPNDLIIVDEDVVKKEIIYMPSNSIVSSKEQEDTVEETRYYMVLNND